MSWEQLSGGEHVVSGPCEDQMSEVVRLEEKQVPEQSHGVSTWRGVRAKVAGKEKMHNLGG